MGLFAAMLVISMHFPPGALRTGLQMNAIYVLIPSLLPLASALQGHMVDYAAHFGGAIGGVVVGLVVLRVWSQTEVSPGFRQAAAAIAVAGLSRWLIRSYPSCKTIKPRPLPRSSFPRINFQRQTPT
jgi:rhomboid protease GluP